MKMTSIIKRIILTILGLTLLANGIFSSTSLYDDSSSDVVTLKTSNFDKLVKEGDSIWIVEFYAPWSEHSKALVPEYLKAARALKGVVKVGALNADEFQSFAEIYNITGFPTITIFNGKKVVVEDYNGGRTAKDFVEAGLKAVRAKVEAQLGAKASGGGGSSSGSSGGGSKDVIELTDSNFDKLVLNSDEPWLVEFYAPWCRYCKNLAPEWAKAASELKGKVKLGALDATVHKNKASQYRVQTYPTIKFFPAGKKTGPEEYGGGRTASSIIEWANSKVSRKYSTS